MFGLVDIMYFQILVVGKQILQVDMDFNMMFSDSRYKVNMVLIRLLNMSFNRMFSDSRYKVNMVLIRLLNMGFNRMFSDPRYKVNMVLIRLLDMAFNRMFSDPRYKVNFVLTRLQNKHTTTINNINIYDRCRVHYTGSYREQACKTVRNENRRDFNCK